MTSVLPIPYEVKSQLRGYSGRVWTSEEIGRGIQLLVLFCFRKGESELRKDM